MSNLKSPPGSHEDAEVQRLLPQRERLIASVVELVEDVGYARVSVAALARHAHVSSATFYKLFADKRECFLTGYRSRARELIERVGRSVAARGTMPAWQAALQALLTFAAEHPGGMLLLGEEAIVAGAAVVEERAQLLGAIVHEIETAHNDRPGLPAKVLGGAVLRLYALRAGADASEGSLTELEDGLVSWMACYEDGAASEQRWGLAPVEEIEAGPPDFAAALVPPQRGTRGRNRQTPEQTATNQRERILHAVAELSHRKGYSETTVAEVVAGAGLAREVFYQHYRDKQDAFLAAYDIGFQTLAGQCAAAFFTAEEWPERVWQALRAFTDFMVNFPAFAHLGMVEAYAIGPHASVRLKERVMGFTIFLEEGYRQDAKIQRAPSAHLAGNRRGDLRDRLRSDARAPRARASRPAAAHRVHRAGAIPRRGTRGPVRQRQAPNGARPCRSAAESLVTALRAAEPQVSVGRRTSLLLWAPFEI